MLRRRGNSLQLTTEKEAIKVRKIHLIIKWGLMSLFVQVEIYLKI
jgi:Ni,Fe-hydrogenase I cytochrome b subunit